MPLIISPDFIKHTSNFQATLNVCLTEIYRKAIKGKFFKEFFLKICDRFVVFKLKNAKIVSFLDLFKLKIDFINIINNMMKFLSVNWKYCDEGTQFRHFIRVR